MRYVVAFVLVVSAACSSPEDPVAALVRRKAGETPAETTPTDAGAPPAPTQAPTATPTAAPTATADAAPPPPVETYVSDLAYVQIANGHGDAEKDKSNGEMGAADGNTITLAGTTYAKGLGVHAASEIRVPLGGQYKTFLADVGVDDEVGDNGSVVFQVSLDGNVVYDSGTLTGASATKKVLVDVTGKQELRLLVGDADGDISYDHADWAGARVVK